VLPRSLELRGIIKRTEDHVLKIEKEYGKENCIDRSEIPPIIIDFDDDESSDEES
jgi:hypothetical protein